MGMQAHLDVLTDHLVREHCTCGAESFVRELELHPPDCMAKRVVRRMAVQVDRDDRLWRECELESAGEGAHDT